jgi:hypothetical protein
MTTWLRVSTLALLAAVSLACSSSKKSGTTPGGGGDNGGGDDTGVLPSASVADPAPGGGGRNFYVGVAGTCPPASYPALNGGACLASLDDVPWGEASGAQARLAAGDTVYISRDGSPYNVKFNVSGVGTATQWIRVHGMLGAAGERPVINGIGATTARHSQFRIVNSPYMEQLQGQGVLHVSAALGDAEAPRYIEIANLNVYGARQENGFTAENGQQFQYGTAGGATAGQPMGAIVTRSARDILVRNCVLHDSAEAIYNWTGGGVAGDPDGGFAGRHTLRGNVFYDTGVVGVERRHATYTEAEGLIYEYNYFGPMIPGATGNQLRDRSAGTIVRYNWIESPAGGAYMLDLMEPEESANHLVPSPLYAHDFVYGNVLVKRRPAGATDAAWRAILDMGLVHWSENNGITTGRTEVAGGYLQFYNNTILVDADFISDYHTPILVNWAEQSDCPATSRPATNDIRNNLVVLLPQTSGAGVPPWYWERCGDGNLTMGVNWLSHNPATQWWEPQAPAPQTGTFTGAASIIDGGTLDPFVAQSAENLRLAATATSALGVGQALSLTVQAANNPWNMNFTPTYQIVGATVGGVTVETRAQSGAGSDLGAIER